MEPRIQYAQTADGVSIAFWVPSQGMPLVAEPSGIWKGDTLEEKSSSPCEARRDG